MLARMVEHIHVLSGFAEIGEIVVLREIIL